MADLTMEGARAALAEQLLRDAAAHDDGRFDEIGRRFDAIEHAFPRGADGRLRTLRTALTFWDAWIDARNHGWQATRGIQPGEWPALARNVATDLLNDGPISSDVVSRHFDATARLSLGERADTLSDRLRRREVSE